MRSFSFAAWSSTLALVSACTTLPDTTPPDLEPTAGNGGVTGGSAGAVTGGTSGTGGASMAGSGGATGGSAGAGGASGGSAGAGGAMSGAGGDGGAGAAAGSGGSSGAGGSSGGALGGAGTGGATAGTSGAGGTAGKGGAGAGGGAGQSGGTSGKGGGSGAGAGGAGGAGSGGKGGAGGAGAGSGGKGGGAPMELANGRTATADSEEDNGGNINPAPQGNDGMTGTRWCAADGMPHYWQVDLGAAHTLVRIEIDFEYPTQADGFPYAYVVSVSPDGTTFTPSIDQSANASSTTTQTANFPASTTGRHVRIAITPPVTTPSTWASFWEARIYGY